MAIHHLLASILTSCVEQDREMTGSDREWYKIQQAHGHQWWGRLGLSLLCTTRAERNALTMCDLR